MTGYAINLSRSINENSSFEEVSFECTLLGIYEIHKQMSSLPENQRAQVAEICRQYSQGAGQGHSYVNMGMECDDTSLSNSMVLLSTEEDSVIKAYSRLAGAKVTLLIKKNHLNLLLSSRNRGAKDLLCQHSISYIGYIKKIGTSGEFIYIGHEVAMYKNRLAVVLRFTDGAAASKQCEDTCIRLKQMSLSQLRSPVTEEPPALPDRNPSQSVIDIKPGRKASISSDGTDDSFYEQLGLSGQEQTTLYIYHEYQYVHGEKSSSK